MASPDASVTSPAPRSSSPSSEPGTFPPQLPSRYLDDVPNQGQEISVSVRTTWDENIVKSDSLQLSITPDQIRDLVYHGSTELRKQPILLVDPSIFRTCVRWILLYQRTWAESKNDTDLKVLAVSWNDLLHHGPQIGDQRHWFLDHATNAYQQFYEASRTTNNFNNARALARVMISSISTTRQYIQAHKRMGRLMGVHYDSFPTTHKDWRPIVNTCIHYLNLAIAKLAEFPDIEPVASDKQLWEYCAYALERRYEAAYQDADVLQGIEYYQILMAKDKDNVKEWLLWSDKLARCHWKRFTTLRIIKEGKDGIAIFEKILEIEPENPHALTGLAELLRQIASAEVLSNATRREITERSITLLEICLANTPDDHPNRANRLGKLSEALVERYGYDADVEDIDKAIALQLIAIGLPKQATASLAFHYSKYLLAVDLKIHYQSYG